MARFDKIEKEQDPHSRGDHRDYQTNLEWSRRFITKMESDLPVGVLITITDSHHLPSSLLMISWTPPRPAPVGNFAAPIFMHAPHTDFTRKVQSVFNQHMRMSRDFSTKHPEWEDKSA
jgi:hypothetical protein